MRDLLEIVRLWLFGILLVTKGIAGLLPRLLGIFWFLQITGVASRLEEVAMVMWG